MLDSHFPRQCDIFSREVERAADDADRASGKDGLLIQFLFLLG
jgi:hypothetical protein